LSGTLPPNSLSGTYAGAVNFSNAANQFSGNGASLTALNASQLTGAVSDGLLSANVALRNGGNTFNGSQLVMGATSASAPPRLRRRWKSMATPRWTAPPIWTAG